MCNQKSAKSHRPFCATTKMMQPQKQNGPTRCLLCRWLIVLGWLVPPSVIFHLMYSRHNCLHSSHTALCCWSHQRAPPCSEQNNLHLSIHKLTCSPKLSLQISSFSCTSYRVKNVTYLLTPLSVNFCLLGFRQRTFR